MTTQTSVALIQLILTDQKTQNIKRITDAIQQGAAKGARLVVLPELHNTLYFCQSEEARNFDLAEAIPGPSTEYFGELAKKLGVVLVLSLFEKRGTGLYHNTAVVIENDGSIVGKYRKMHIPEDPGFYEKFYFAPGDLGFNPISTSCGRLGVLICWDQWFPEAARLETLACADLLIYPTAIGWDPNDTKEEKERQRAAWQTIQRAHAIANGIPVVVCNRTGFEGSSATAGMGIEFWGSSFMAGPQGEILSEAPISEGAVLIETIDHQRTEQVRRTWPYLRDRRIDAYQDLQKRFLL